MFSREKLRQALTLYAVTDRTWLEGRSLAQCVEQALEGGATFIQLREKEAPSAALVLWARELKSLCEKAGVPFIINDDVEVARIMGADGVHVGQSDTACAEAREALGPDAIIGVSVQTVEQAQQAQAAGADYLGVGAIFATPTKPEAEALGIDALAAICKAVDIPVVAIGGLTKQTIPQLSGSAAAGVALVSAIFAAEDIRQTTQDLRKVTEVALCLETN